MIRHGLVSITFRKMTPVEIVELCVDAGLGAVEWGADVHVPHGNAERAREVATMTRDAGLEMPSYGTYYRIGHSEAEGMPLDGIFNSALTLGVPLVRLWAGRKGSADADEAYWKSIVEETRRIADRADKAGLNISFEFHRGALTDTGESTRRFLEDIGHPRVRTHWQPAVGLTVEQRLESLRAVLPWLAVLHVFQWGPTGGQDKRHLAEGVKEWALYLDAARATGRDLHAMMEFVPDDSAESLKIDAATLGEWVKKA